MRVRRLAVATAGTLATVLLAAAPAVATPGPSDAPQWWFDTWHVTSLWNSGPRGQGITIAEIDTGVNAQVPELSGSVLPGKDFGYPSGDGRIDHEVDNFGHGTAMASIMVAKPGLLGITGLAPEAKVLPVAVPIRGTDDSSDGGDDHLSEAIRWAVDHGGKIISMSLGGKRDPVTDTMPCPDAEQAAVTYAISKGAIVVAASGNSGDNGSPVEDPGVCLGVVSVGAVDIDNAVADFSSRHPYLTVSAPGVNIPSLGRVPGTAFSGSGTSQATAVTSATLALVWSKYPRLTARQVVARLLNTVDRRTATRDPAYGYGIINAQRALDATVSPSAANPVYAALDPFLARQAAKAKSSATPSSSATSPTPTGELGQYAVGSPPSPITSRVIIGAVVAAASLIGLLTLVLVGVRGRRRTPRYAVPYAAEPAPMMWNPPPPPLAPTPVAPPAPPDQGGVVWHDVSGPVWPYPPPGTVGGRDQAQPRPSRSDPGAGSTDAPQG